MCIYVCAHKHAYMLSKEDGDSAGSPDGKEVTRPELFLQERWWPSGEPHTLVPVPRPTGNHALGSSLCHVLGSF